MDTIDEIVVRRFFVLYGQPGTLDDEAFVDEYRRSLRGVDADILREAINVVVDRNTFRAWPTVGECREMVNTIATRRMIARDRESIGGTPAFASNNSTSEQRERVAALIKAAAAKMRANEKAAIEERAIAADAPLDWKATTRPAWEARFGKPLAGEPA